MGKILNLESDDADAATEKRKDTAHRAKEYRTLQGIPQPSLGFITRPEVALFRSVAEV